MENGVLEFDIGLGVGDDGIGIEPPNDDEQMHDGSPNDANSLGSGSGDSAFAYHTYIPEGDLDLEPYEGMEFESEEAAKAFYNSYARRVGFSTRVSSSRRSRKDGAIIQRSFVCAKEGFRNLNEKRTKDREIKRPRTVTRVGCKASLSVKIQDSGKWVVSGFIKEHNHELVPPDQPFRDTVTFDTTYRSNRYRLPFVPFTGLNHHGQPVLFGCAFLINESEASFVWLFKTWLAAMSGRSPLSITTEYDAVIRSAIMQVFPSTRHRFCKWHIFKQCQEKLSNVLLKHPHFEATFHKCVNLSESAEEFECSWHSLIDKYDLRDHKWIQAIYADRRQWAPVYLRDTFFAEMSITQRSDSMNSYFDGYVNASTNLNQFFKLYEKALESRHEKEVKADFDTMNTSPVLKTPSPMEKQASEFYTRKLFVRFQEELVSTLTFMASKVEDDGEVTTYQVSKFGEDHKAYHVRFNVLEMRATCSCQMFEFSGLLCRHVLAVFRVTNVLTLPSHYILKRWTRNAKSSVILEERVTDPFNSYLESHTVRYNTLRHEAFKFVDEGAESVDSYNVAMAALAEASKKVAIAIKKDGKTFMTNGPMRDVSAKGGVWPNHCTGEGQGSSAQQLSEDDMDQKINELSVDLDRANRKCEVYRTNLLSLLKDIEDHKQRLSIEVQNIKLSMKDGL
ncbi:hypothetical protein DH2020_000344 [Rehmannia glutinosa]|uniref:Protein FAR1-RELATED SEQUENCE n=1 Tax=Rehmannia glutinosa TaxID=99300 RepID=A0ABR0XW89_REHGL